MKNKVGWIKKYLKYEDRERLGSGTSDGGRTSLLSCACAARISFACSSADESAALGAAVGVELPLCWLTARCRSCAASGALSMFELRVRTQCMHPSQKRHWHWQPSGVIREVDREFSHPSTHSPETAPIRKPITHLGNAFKAFELASNLNVSGVPAKAPYS
jgi:hypothetical protein